jgi:hypothetical protein
VNALALVLNENFRKLGCLELWWLGVFIALNHQQAVGKSCCRWAHRTVQCATGHCPVRQPRHPTVRVLEQSTVGGFVFKRHRTVQCGTGQVMFTVRCISDTAVLTLCALFFTIHVLGRHCGRLLSWIVVAPLVHQTVR